MFNWIKVPSITWAEVKPSMTLIDVREVDEYRQRHIPRSKNIPLSKIAEFKPQGTVYLFCASGMRSKRAVKYLIKQGYQAVNIKGGLMSYGQ